MKLDNKTWTKENYNKFLEELTIQSDLKFKQFSKKIILDDSLIGVRTDKLKYYAKEICKGNYESYLNVSNPQTYEEKLIYGLIICNIKELNLKTIEYINNYSKKINNWALCDLFCSNLKIVKKNKEIFLKKIKINIKNKNFWIKRMCFVLLINYYIELRYLDFIFEMCDTYNTNDYYVQMSVAWLLSMCYIKYKDKTLEYLENNKLDDFTYNKTIQKIIDSKRINIEEKEKLRKMKRRKI